MSVEPRVRKGTETVEDPGLFKEARTPERAGCAIVRITTVLLTWGMSRDIRTSDGSSL